MPLFKVMLLADTLINESLITSLGAETPRRKLPAAVPTNQRSESSHAMVIVIYLTDFVDVFRFRSYR